jgi:hypothetical protein
MARCEADWARSKWLEIKIWRRGGIRTPGTAFDRTTVQQLSAPARREQTQSLTGRAPAPLVEVKAGDKDLSPSLGYFQGQTKAAHAFQVVIDFAYEAADCFRVARPIVVPAKTFLSQLL